jgi:hypothetical protein
MIVIEEKNWALPESLHDVRAYVVVIVMRRVAAHWRVHGHAGQLGEVQQVRLAHLRRQTPNLQNWCGGSMKFWYGSVFKTSTKKLFFFFYVFLLITFRRYIYIVFQR